MSIRCALRIHSWRRTGNGWSCRRCAKPARGCTNCGGRHGLDAAMICTADRRRSH